MNETCETGKRTLSRFRLWLAALAGVAALVLAHPAFHAERHLETAARIEGGQAESVARQLASRFRSPFVDRVVLVVQGPPAPDSEEGAKFLRKIAGAMDDPAISGVLAVWIWPIPFFRGTVGDSRLLGVREATGGVFPIVPIQTFGIVFGLSMDYEVFLVARVLAARRSGLSELEAISEGLARTGGLITSAAAILIVVFAGFRLGDFLVPKMLESTLAVAVLMDATLVRMVVGPALLSLAGDWNWWPWGLKGALRAPARARVLS